MGYELTMFVVERTNHHSDARLVLVEDNVYSAFSEEDPDATIKKLVYFPDGKTKMYVSKKQHIIKESYCQIIAVVELCKTGDDLKTTGIFSFEESDGCYMYIPTDGNKYIGLDSYEAYRSFVPIDTVIKEMTRAIRKDKDNPYRRYIIALATLKAIKKTFSGSDMGCLFYGH